MTEAYLQFVWHKMRLPVPELCLTDGTPVIVKSPGEHNELRSGPDFFHGIVEFDQITFHGPIEIHVNASDWYKHGHHEDRAYDPVILHVVLNNDESVVQNGRKLPTLELNQFLDQEHKLKFQEQLKFVDGLPCGGELHSLDDIFLESMKARAIARKLEDKKDELIEACVHLESKVDVFYYLLGTAFGMSINKTAFKHLVLSLPWGELRSLGALQRYQFIWVNSGLLEERAISEWHHRGTRPGNFPSKRLHEFATLVSYSDLDRLISVNGINDFCLELSAWLMRFKKGKSSLLTKKMIDHLMVNVAIPFLFITIEDREKNEAIDLLENYPAEQNRIISKWSKLGVSVCNAYDSQGLLALHKYYCYRKKCLSCGVAQKLLNRTK